MRRIRVKLRCAEDCRRIAGVLAIRDVACDEVSAEDLWERVSFRWNAGWLGLPDDDAELFEAVMGAVEDGELIEDGA